MTDYARLKVKELRQLLKDAGLATTGLKAVLIQRLEDAHKQSALPAAASAVAPPSPPEQQPTASTSKLDPVPAPLFPPVAPPAPAPVFESPPPPPPAKKARLEPPAPAPTPAPEPKSAPAPAICGVEKHPQNKVAPSARPKPTAFKSPFLGAAASHASATNPRPLPIPFAVPQLFSRPTFSSADAAAFLATTWPYHLWAHLNPSQPFNLISPDLYSSPSHPNQFNTAFRFISNRFWMALSTPSPSTIESDAHSNLNLDAIRALPIVFECEPVVREIWKIVTASRNASAKGKGAGGGTTTHYILAATGEVLGTTLTPAMRTQSIGLPNFSVRAKTARKEPSSTTLDSRLQLRSDWADYIDEARTNTDQRSGMGLLGRMRTSDDGDFLWGLSRGFREGRGRGGARIGEEERTVAVSYVLSHLSPTSVSGPPATLSALSHLHDSLPSPALAIHYNAPTKLALYLPPPHHLESVYLPPGQPFAIVETAQGTRYVLKETGQDVGSEAEGGLWDTWREVFQLGT